MADNAVVLQRLEPIEVGTDRFEDQSGGIDFDVVVETVRTEQPGFYELQIRVSELDEDRILSERRAFLYDAPAQPTSGTGS